MNKEISEAINSLKLRQYEDDDEMITSISPTIDIKTQRTLAELRQVNPLLTQGEANEIFKVYLSALDRVMKENGKDF